VITKIVYRYFSGKINSVLVDIKCTANNNTKIINLVTDLSELMRERNVDIAKLNSKKLQVVKNYHLQNLNIPYLCNALIWPLHNSNV
tara:strand:+ start:275 stop:535 length:261 start_codon:yes stop_codon:yes gene_type:complete